MRQKQMEQESLLITNAKEGDQKAYRALYDLHVGPLFRFLKQFTSESAEVEEWVQRAFVKAFEHLGSFDGRSRFSTWLFTLGINEMRMDRRRARRTPVGPIADEEVSMPDAEPDEFEWEEMMGVWMKDLDETKRAVFALYEVEGYSHAEIAGMLGIGESTSRTILSRTKRYLKDRWKSEGMKR
jgi:RNA polymerase sigma factor (sigma-70 family)